MKRWMLISALASALALGLAACGEEETKPEGEPNDNPSTTCTVDQTAACEGKCGTITVKVYKGEIMASIMVQDTGIGLTPEEAKMVFARFWRAEAGRNRESGGLGIGLSVVKEIVDRHGGWVEVQGKKDEGARFIIHLPLYSKERELAQQREAARQQRRLGKRSNR